MSDRFALKLRIIDLLPKDGASIGNIRLFGLLTKEFPGIEQQEYELARDEIVQEGLLLKGKGKGGSVRRSEKDLPEHYVTNQGSDRQVFVAQPVGDADSHNQKGGVVATNPAEGQEANQVMDDVQSHLQQDQSGAGKSKPPSDHTSSRIRGNVPGNEKRIESYRYNDKRINNPEVGIVRPENDPETRQTRWSYDPHLDPALQFDIGRNEIEKLIDDALASGNEQTMREALEELKRMQAPYLNWTGKTERTSFEVDTVSLHVHERIDPATILRAVRKKQPRKQYQVSLFDNPFDKLPLRKALDFYKHERGWSNRMIAGDSLLVMNSLLQKESMAGQVQMIYIDPPYGIKYGSNFQPFVNKRDVSSSDKDEDLTQEPEMIKSFRDTWELGIHSYLTYLRDRLLLASELLNESGSIFVQISDDNIHHVRELMDEVFGAKNFVSSISFSKTTGKGGRYIDETADYLLWYAKDHKSLKFRRLYREKKYGGDGAKEYRYLMRSDGSWRDIKPIEFHDIKALTKQGKVFSHDNFTSQTGSETIVFSFEIGGEIIHPPTKGGWKTNRKGLEILKKCNRLIRLGKTPRFVRFFDDFPIYPLDNHWIDTRISGFGDPKIYVVQTYAKVIQRCLLMTTDPGDLVLDPTCGSGTTAYVAEKWGRRWITCDTSRVALTLAKQRLMTAGFDYYTLRYPQEGIKGGFHYETVPHITLKSIANNPEIDEIYERMHPAIDKALAELNNALKGQAITYASPRGGRAGQSIDFTVPDSQTVELPSGETVQANALLEWEVPFDFPDAEEAGENAWPEEARKPFKAFHVTRQRMQQAMDESIAAHADQETLYDKPKVDTKKQRISGPFTVEAVPSPTVVSLEQAQPPEEADESVAREGETSRLAFYRDELFRTGVRGKGGQMLTLAELDPLPELRYIHARGTLADSGEEVVVSFGPEHMALEQRQVESALHDAEKLRPAPKYIIFCSFEFDPEAAKDIDEMKWPGVTLLKAKMNADLLTEDLKKSRKSNESFWLMGQPDVEARRREDSLWEIEVCGFDYFDPASGELLSGGTGKIAMWSLDTDYDERSLFPRQVFFPMAGSKDGWKRLKATIRASLDEERLEAFHGTVSLPFKAGENKKVAVKIVDDRGIESFKIIPLGQE